MTALIIEIIITILVSTTPSSPEPGNKGRMPITVDGTGKKLKR